MKLNNKNDLFFTQQESNIIKRWNINEINNKIEDIGE